MPGRIVGETVDKNSVALLCLQYKQGNNISEGKATSNICSNQALNALAATIYLTVMGKQGLRKVAMLCTQKAHYAYQHLLETGAFTPCFQAPFFKEFTVQFNGDVSNLNDKLMEQGIIGGFALEKEYPSLKNGYLVAVTEKRTKEEIDRFVRKAATLC